MQNKYDSIQHLDPEKFRRLTGVKKETFQVMVEILHQAESLRRGKGGPKRKLSVEDMLLLALEYLREYRTYFHVATSFGVSESQAQRIHRWVEETLIKDKRFHLPGRKELLKSDCEFEVIIVDASESPIERPKKNVPLKPEKIGKGTTIQAKSMISASLKTVLCTA